MVTIFKSISTLWNLTRAIIPLQAQHQIETQYAPRAPEFNTSGPSAPNLSPPGYESLGANLYPVLGNYMGLELSEEVLPLNGTDYAVVAREAVSFI